MAKNLVIVESPAKVKTIKKFLGANYEVIASQGHVRDLPKSSIGIDVEHDYEPKYITIRGKGDVLAALRKETKKAEKIYLATDPDREGEAISWHLLYALKLNECKDKKVYRITFNEITKKAVKESLKNPREINTDLVDAQQARRILDRMVGYRISPILWKKVKSGLSAGRVQSVALRIICEREKEIEEFVPKEYWSLDAYLQVQGKKKPLIAKYYGNASGKVEISSKEEMDALQKKLENVSFSVMDIKESERRKKPPLPFTTSTLQQEASKELNFTTQKTMQVAQQLYEGVDIKGEGTVGLITYLRTDSVRISEEATAQATEFIKEKYSDAYLQSENDKPKIKQKIQDAHEAIRPTDINRHPETLKEQLPKDLYRLYNLIWKRFLASQMSGAVYQTTSVKIAAGDQIFTTAGSKVGFDGFMCVYTTEEDREENKTVLSDIEQNSQISLDKYEAQQHFTTPPAHYTEASLVKTLEEQGIGRPSTYAPTITVIRKRNYITKEGRNLFVTELGDVVNQMMVNAFPSIVDIKFTANMETLLDGVADGDVKWKTIVSNFYPDLDEAVKEAEQSLEEVTIKEEESDEICEKCGKKMVFRLGTNGRFLACPGFPNCVNTKPFYEKIGVNCPKCNGEVVLKRTRKGRKYYGCLNNPECDFMVWQKPVNEKCPICGNLLLPKGNKLVCADPTCSFRKDK